MVKQNLIVEVLAIAIFTVNFKLVYSLCNAYPKIFGEQTNNITFNDIEIHEQTDTIVSCGGIQDATIFSTSNPYPIIVVSSLTTTDVKWAVTDYTMGNKKAFKVTISANGKFIVSLIGRIGVRNHLLVFNAIDRTVISSRNILHGG
jgi:hypothetical protein